MNTARELVRQSLDYPALLDEIGDDDDLIAAGVNSGEMIRVALQCEEHAGRPLTDGELARLNSISVIAEILGCARVAD